ncbi:PocR ligand-binding domain-containing protein [Methanotorris formicicus]|uniref:PocR domain-containing protein n=1 Tax=Methanotorris formicicus Mc-S-70 TaxID=647171 RepID=H1L0F7_9EURY|nr:PocR ligand-binding domain-containing protein [Methanotorris formicicus]EHP84880.1 hypothetical protein MetfoDRAFT_1531 [Methanotorris formicicus Mc-S-70]
MDLERIQKINILILKPISRLLKANVATFNKEGEVIEPFYFGNEVCRMIKSHKVGESICQDSHKMVLNSVKLKNNMVKKGIIEKRPPKITNFEDEQEDIIVDYCNAGLLKVLYPIKNDEGEIVGYTGICGCFKEGYEKYSLKKLSTISKILGFDEEEFLNLAKSEIKSLSEKDIKAILELVKNMIKHNIDLKELYTCLSKEELGEEDEECILKFIECFIHPMGEFIGSNLVIFDDRFNALFVMDYDGFSFIMEHVGSNKDKIKKLKEPLFLKQERIFIIPMYELYLIGTINENCKYTTEEIKEFVYVIYQYYKSIL